MNFGGWDPVVSVTPMRSGGTFAKVVGLALVVLEMTSLVEPYLEGAMS